jgi:hypothetical protein
MAAPQPHSSRVEPRLIMRISLLAAALLTLATPHAIPADEQGRYWHGGGVGAVECPAFVDSLERARRSGLGSIEYVTQTQGYVMFLSGFQTAYNLRSAETCSIFSGVSVDQKLFWIENYCRRNPIEKFSGAVVALAAEVHPRRQRSCK